MSQAVRTPHARSLKGLDWANLFLADVRDGVGPFLGIYLLASHDWDAAGIGVAMAAMGLASVITQTPAGALIDSTRRKRLLMALATAVVGMSCILMTIPAFVNIYAIVAFQALMGMAAAILMPGLAAITLGMVGFKRYPGRQGRNEMFNHAGNAASAILAGVLGYLLSPEWVFFAVALFAVASIVSILAIREEDIDHELARAAPESADKEHPKTAGLLTVLADRRLLMFAISVVLFHFANAAMMPVVGQYMASSAPEGATLYMSACIVVAQLVMIPMAKFAGRYCEIWGRKPVFLLAFAALPIRGLLYTVSDDPAWLIAVQTLDGIGAGIFGVVWLVMCADLTRGTGRYNVTVGAIATAHAIGASASNVVTGFVVAATSYAGGFTFLAGAAMVGLIFFWTMVGETKPKTEDEPASAAQPA